MQLLKTTKSVCPTCLTELPARVEERDGRVYLTKNCPDHGPDETLLADDARRYWNAGPEGGKGCCTLNHSCTLIFEITERCNLTCPTCFSGSSPEHAYQLSFDDFERQLGQLLGAGKSNADIVQISGGEPTIHPDVERMIELAFARGVRKIYLNTNGVRIAKDRDFVARLAAIDAGQDRLQLYLQFDGFEDRTYELIRGKRGLYREKRKAIENLLAVGLYVLPVMTVTRGVNLDEIGAVVRLVLEHHPKMNTVILQPAFYAGRYEGERAGVGGGERVTLAEVAREVARQTDGLFAPEDFGPIPCSHPNCFALAVGLVRDGKVIPVSRYFPQFDSWREPAVAATIERFADRMPQTMLETLGDDALVESLLDLLADGDERANWSDYRSFVLIGIKPFMDAHSYDRDRVDRCCVHVVDRQGLPVSLCEYNTLRRPRGQS
ncbi:MAG: radical SAM protein [Myxococcales bacterium]|nr:radical SAM protein [Myxococcales bacterium]